MFGMRLMRATSIIPSFKKMMPRSSPVLMDSSRCLATQRQMSAASLRQAYWNFKMTRWIFNFTRPVGLSATEFSCLTHATDNDDNNVAIGIWHLEIMASTLFREDRSLCTQMYKRLTSVGPNLVIPDESRSAFRCGVRHCRRWQ
jgi:hypothetical protein